jgi:hypothetical protein
VLPRVYERAEEFIVDVVTRMSKVVIGREDTINFPDCREDYEDYLSASILHHTRHAWWYAFL